MRGGGEESRTSMESSGIKKDRAAHRRKGEGQRKGTRRIYIPSYSSILGKPQKKEVLRERNISAGRGNLKRVPGGTKNNTGDLG